MSINSIEELNIIKQNYKYYLIFFYAEWCFYSKLFEPIYDRIKNDYPNLFFGKINIDEMKEIANQYDIQYVPTTILFKNGFILENMRNEDEIREVLNQLD